MEFNIPDIPHVQATVQENTVPQEREWVGGEGDFSFMSFVVQSKYEERKSAELEDSQVTQICEEISIVDPSIVCICGTDLGDERYSLTLRGYQSVCDARCLISWKPADFSLTAKRNLKFGGQKESLGLVLTLFHRFHHESVHICLLQLTRDSSGKSQFLQIHCLMKLIERLVKPSENLILSGNFNFDPASACYFYLETGSVDLSRVQCKSLLGIVPCTMNLPLTEASEITCNRRYSFIHRNPSDGLTQHFNSYHFQLEDYEFVMKKQHSEERNRPITHSYTVNSAYLAVLNKEIFPTFISESLKGVCDYIWWGGPLQTTAVLDRLQYPVLVQRAAQLASSHIPLAAKFKFANS